MPTAKTLDTEFLLLPDQLLHECEAMTLFAVANGKKIPSPTAQLLERLMQDYAGSLPAPLVANSGDSEPAVAEKVRTPLYSSVSLSTLLSAHEQLAALVAPSLPASILFLQTEERKAGRFSFLGPVPLIRHLMVVSLLSLFCFIGLSTLPEVTGNVNWEKSDGWELFANELFVIFAAMMGATFSSLFKAHQYICNGTFNAKLDYFAWIKLCLGMVAGTILAILIPDSALVDNGSTPILSKPLLAMLGGFSVELVHKLFDRLLFTLTTLIQGDTRQGGRQAEAQADYHGDAKNPQSQLQVATKLLALKEQLDTETDIEQLRKTLDELLKESLTVQTDKAAK